jgi:hypothetical protein
MRFNWWMPMMTGFARRRIGHNDRFIALVDEAAPEH